MYFDPVEPGLAQVRHRLAVRLVHHPDFVARYRVGRTAHSAVFELRHRRRQRRGARREGLPMARGLPVVPELREDLAAGVVNGIGQRPERGHGLGRIGARLIASAARMERCS